MPIPSRWVIWAVLVCGLAFLAGGVSNAAKGDPVESAAGLAIGGILVAVFWLQRQEQKRAIAFFEWLAANAEAIVQRGGAQYGDRRVTGDTRTRELTLCVSFLIAGFRLPSRPIIEGAERLGGRAAVYTLGTLLLGWWSIHGLFWTPVALFSNLRGGRQVTVRDHIAALPQL